MYIYFLWLYNKNIGEIHNTQKLVAMESRINESDPNVVSQSVAEQLVSCHCVDSTERA